MIGYEDTNGTRPDEDDFPNRHISDMGKILCHATGRGIPMDCGMIGSYPLHEYCPQCVANLPIHIRSQLLTSTSVHPSWRRRKN